MRQPTPGFDRQESRPGSMCHQHHSLFPQVVVPGQLGGLELRHRQHAPGGGPDPPGQGTGLANLPCHRSDANAAWLEIIMPQQIWWPGPNCSDSKTNRIWPRANRHLPIPSPARRHPHHPRRPTDPVADRRHPGDGPPPFPKDGNDYGRLHLTPQFTSTRPEEPTVPGTPARRAPPADSSCPDATISPTSRPAPALSEPKPAARKIEVSTDGATRAAGALSCLSPVAS